MLRKGEESATEQRHDVRPRAARPHLCGVLNKDFEQQRNNARIFVKTGQSAGKRYEDGIKHRHRLA